MNEIKSSIIYFEESGRDNSKRVFELVAQRAKEMGISTIVVASTTGYSGSLAVKMLPEFKVVVVSHVAGYAGPNT